MIKCALCGYEFDETRLACHSQCPLAEGCAILCCPNCGYQSVDESKSSLADWLKRAWRLVAASQRTIEAKGRE